MWLVSVCLCLLGFVETLFCPFLTPMLVVGRISRRIVALANRVSKLALGFNAYEEMLKEMVDHAVRRNAPQETLSTQPLLEGNALNTRRLVIMGGLVGACAYSA